MGVEVRGLEPLLRREATVMLLVECAPGDRTAAAAALGEAAQAIGRLPGSSGDDAPGPKLVLAPITTPVGPALFADLGEKDALEVAVAQRIGQRQHLQAARHALDFGIQHQANAAHCVQHALRRILPILLVIMKNDPASEDDQRQRGSSYEKRKANEIFGKACDGCDASDRR